MRPRTEGHSAGSGCIKEQVALKYEVSMRRVILMALLGSLLLLGACSYATDFVIVNESDAAIIVRYEVNDFPGPFYPPTTPSVIAASELSEDGRQWTSTQFQIDEASRSVTAQLMPGRAFRVATMNHYSGHDDPTDDYKYQIRRIVVSGAHGKLEFTDEQARTAFTRVARSLYTLTYK